MKYLLGFIGYGEAAYLISNGLMKEGLSGMAAFDIRLADAEAGQFIRGRAKESNVDIVDSLENLCTSCQIVASLTSAGVALAVAQQAIPFLSKGQVYADLNAAGPGVKKKISDLTRKEGVLVCDAAVMNPVPGMGHKVPISLAGDGATVFYDSLNKYGMNLTNLNAPAGAASAIKMFRSVFMKGLPQILMEAMLPAMKYGALDALASSLTATISGKTIEQLANQFIPRTIIHAERRAHEMEEASITLEDLGCDASMSRACEHKLEMLAKSGKGALLPPDGKVDYREALKLLL